MHPSIRLSLLALVSLLLTGGGLAGCGGPTPEAVGDECEPDGDPCPGGSVCAPGGEENICQLPPGSPCDPLGPDYCLGTSTCSPTDAGGGVCSLGEGSACDPANDLCGAGLACEESPAGPTCFAAMLMQGMVFDAETEAAIAGARVTAFDDSASAISDVAVTAADGTYSLQVPVARNADGSPVGDTIFTLRAEGQDYQPFPSGVRTALPISASEATSTAGGWILDSALTDIALIALPVDEQGRPSISGSVDAGADSEGVLVVADAGSGGISTVSDKSGGYTIFNVPDGSYEVRGYAAGVNLTPASVDISGAPAMGVNLVVSGDALGSIEGSIQIVNAPGGSATSVVLVVESTFQDDFVKGEVPRGLRAPLTGPPSIDGGFTIEGVPEGTYVVLASFENDDLVRDPDEGISGTDIVRVDMPAPGEAVVLDQSFKVTEALALIGPGAEEPEAVTGTPTLEWADDSSEDFYTVEVFNSFGDLVWEDDMVPSVSGGSGTVSVEYGGPALESGMYYQFRATSWRNGSPISRTEDLRGVFFAE